MSENSERPAASTWAEFVLSLLAYLAWLLMSVAGTALVAYLAYLHHACVCFLAPIWLLLMVAAWGDFHE